MFPQVAVIAIDGPSKSGKSTVARKLAYQKGRLYLDSGALYRALGVWADNRGYDLEDDKVCGKLAQTVELQVQHIVNQQFHSNLISIDGQDLSADVRGRNAGHLASQISKLPSVREVVTEFIRRHVAGQRAIIDGRDIGTVVFPTAELKVWLIADDAARELRAQAEVYDDVVADLQRRDAQDASRAIAPAEPAVDAVIIDSSLMNADEVVQQVRELLDATTRPRRITREQPRGRPVWVYAS
jgi:cytidylate kinase